VNVNKPLVEIWDTVVGLGVIIEFPTGVLMSHQTGGNACLKPKVEGIYLPLANDYIEETKEFLSPEIELSNYFCKKYDGSGATSGIDLEDVENINAIITKFGLNKFIEVDLGNLKQSHEAWIKIKINEEKKNPLVKGFSDYPIGGVLIWSNSD